MAVSFPFFQLFSLPPETQSVTQIAEIDSAAPNLSKKGREKKDLTGTPSGTAGVLNFIVNHLQNPSWCLKMFYLALLEVGWLLLNGVYSASVHEAETRQLMVASSIICSFACLLYIVTFLLILILKCRSRFFFFFLFFRQRMHLELTSSWLREILFCLFVCLYIVTLHLHH